MKLKDLIQNVQDARLHFLATTSPLTDEQVIFKPSSENWCITEIVEHMVWAELGGINGIWKAIAGIKNKQPVWMGEAIHQGLSIEQIIQKTWREKEIVPENAKPSWGGPIDYWRASLLNNQNLLQLLSSALEGLNPEIVIYPHIISGPLNVYQRLEFLRFHLERHQKQIENIKAHPDFPQS
ncbi:DinB family protein [Adhaeribacter radiodurans]|uniref:DinB family protein n=1 Tax=Adhaeribacter radiodurans TaxID=2745197 RepID=A0A7L7L5W7_9BACT|nr:DinB family protein [Adhaeribacter radiodurans]QMU28180.1 DinB family protein [Adhaeribacter radiodurans]